MGAGDRREEAPAERGGLAKLLLPDTACEKRCRPGRGPSWPGRIRPGREAQALALPRRRRDPRAARNEVSRRNRANLEEIQQQAATITEDNFQRFRQAADQEFRGADSNGDGFLSQDEMRTRFPYLAKEFQRVDRTATAAFRRANTSRPSAR